jgi:hypothetical protein
MSTERSTTTPPAAPRPHRRRGMFWPLVLIGIGLVALFANYGLVQPVSIVSLLALWPVLLILLGIDIAFSRRWPIPTLAAEVVIIGAALLLAATQPAALSLASFTFTNSGCPSPASSVLAPRGGMQALTLRIDGGAARYHLTSGASGAVEATSDQAELCLRDRSSNGGNGDIAISQSGTRFGNSPTIEVRVASDIPLSLQMNAGAGEFTLDLHDVRLTDARLNVGASSTTIILPHPSSGELPIRVDGGASSLVIEIPSDVEARVTVSGGLVSSNSSNPRTTKSGNTIETTGYAAAKDRVTITVNGGASSVAVR